MHRKPLTGWLKRLAHVVALLAGWLLFGWFWWHVLATQEIYRPGLILLLAGSAIIFPVVTLFWVKHNRRIYRAKGPRRRIRAVTEQYAHDWEGRAIVSDWSALRHARSIVVRLDAESKVYQ